jgi:hypothetical protein
MMVSVRGIGREWCHTGRMHDHQQQMNVEWTIAQSLGSPIDVHDWCQGWQVLYNNNPKAIEHQGMSTTNTIPVDEQEEWKHNVQRTLRSRAFDMTSRKRRLDSLRQDLNPFQKEQPKSQVTNRHFSGKARSFHLAEE